MANLKHIGRMKANRAKVLVAFRTLPGDAFNALVIGTANLSDDQHNAIINLVESPQAQDVYEFGEILSSRFFPDGRPMLSALHQDGKLVKVPTSDVEMTPSPNTSIPLDELNALIAEQRGLAVDDLSLKAPGEEEKAKEAVKEVKETPATPPKASSEPLSDKDIAKSYRSQADAMYKEAAKLRKQADELDPPQKKATKNKEEEIGA